MTKNEQAIAAFCAQFNPPLRYVRTERINNAPIPDAWQTTVWDKEKSIGITVVVYMESIHAYIEASGQSDIAEYTGKLFAKVWENRP